MKILITFIALSMFHGSCFAMGRVLALCSTQDGEYTVIVAEKLGVVKKRTEFVLAAIKDAQGHYVAAFQAEVKTGQSGSYGGVAYVDRATDGEKFTLSAPALGEHGFVLGSQITLGENEVLLFDPNMQCSAYNRQLPGR